MWLIFEDEDEVYSHNRVHVFDYICLNEMDALEFIKDGRMKDNVDKIIRDIERKRGPSSQWIQIWSNVEHLKKLGLL